MLLLCFQTGAPLGCTAEKNLVAELKQCTRSRDFHTGVELHLQATLTGQLANKHVVSSLINFYSKCGAMSDAQQVFDASLRFHQPDVVSWTALIMGYVHNGHSELALQLFRSMNCAPNSRSFVAAVCACASLAAEDREKHPGAISEWVEKGKCIHALAANYNCIGDIFVANALIDMYSKCGFMFDARRFFDQMAHRDVVSWTALLQGYVDNGHSELALELFHEMERTQSSVPDVRAYATALSACASLAAREKRRAGEDTSSWLETGKSLHAKAVENRCCSLYVENTLIDMYGRCGSMIDARRVFNGMVRKDVISWNSLLQGYLVNQESDTVLSLFEEMTESGCLPDARTFLAALTACAALAGKENGSSRRWLAKGQSLHSLAAERKCCNMYVESAAVDLYAKSGYMKLARAVFDGMKERSVVSWNALLMGYVENKGEETVLEMIRGIDVRPDSLTFVPGLMACGNLMAAERGRCVHADVLLHGFEEDEVVTNCLVDFYGKCGGVDVAQHLFDSSSGKKTISWTTLMCGYGLKGDTNRVFELFEEMRNQSVTPDDVTFVCVLAACSHAGLTHKGRKYFEAMQAEYNVRPTIKHYACMVDLLGRGNLLPEAMEVLRNMPFEADVVMWTAVLGACRKWNNVSVGRVAYQALTRLGGEKDGSAYVLMASIYDALGGMEERPSTCLLTQTCSWTDNQGRVHKFQSNRPH